MHRVIILPGISFCKKKKTCTLYVSSTHAPWVVTDIANADDNPMSRRKSFKKSLRESFRRLRKGRSQRNVDKKTRTGDPAKKDL